MAASGLAAINRTVCIIARCTHPFPKSVELRARLPATTLPRSSVRDLSQGSPPTSLGQTRRYFLSKCTYLLAKVTQCRRNGFDHQLPDADFAVLPYLLDDHVWVAMESGRGIGVVDRPTNPGLGSEPQREVRCVPTMDSLSARFARRM